MKFENLNQKEAIYEGEIQNNRVSIQNEDKEWILSILSTNLYSDPIGSFLRETVSNAWDSHIEAGVDSPVILEIGQDTEDVFYCRIQDFGVGISEERFNTVYKNLGASTKRQTNDMIGGFGIGKFASLAYSDTVRITSIYDKVKYVYLMYKDGNSINIDLLSKIDTTEGNGVEIYVEIAPSDVVTFQEKIAQQLKYFENLYLIDNTTDHYYANINRFVEGYNESKIKHYSNFSVGTLNESGRSKTISILLGKVLYPIDFSQSDFIPVGSTKAHHSVNAALRFEIGELDITPNRENLQYTSKTIEAIKQKLIDYENEIALLTEDSFVFKVENFEEGLKKVNSKLEYCLLEDQRGDSYNSSVFCRFSYTLTHKNKTDIVFDDKFRFTDYDLFESFIRAYDRVVFEHTLPISSSYQTNSGRIERIDHPLTVYRARDYKERYGLYICKMSNLKNDSKSYIRETPEYNSGAYFISFRERSIAWYYKNFLEHLKGNPATKKLSSDYKKYYFKTLLKEISGYPRFSNDDVPKAWFEKKKAERKSGRRSSLNWNKKFTYYELRPTTHGRAGDVTTDSVNRELSHFVETNKNKLVIYGERGDTRIGDLYNIYKSQRGLSPILFIEIAPTRIKWIEDMENAKSVDEVYKTFDYKFLRDYSTRLHINKAYPHLPSIAYTQGVERVSEQLHEVLQKVKEFLDISDGLCAGISPSMSEEIYELCLKTDTFNQEIMKLLNSNDRILKNSGVLRYFTQTGSYYRYNNLDTDKINLLVDYALARKLFIVNSEAIDKLKEETIYNIKKEDQNESI